MKPLDDMTWEERFWVAFRAVVDLEKKLAMKTAVTPGQTKLTLDPALYEASLRLAWGRTNGRMFSHSSLEQFEPRRLQKRRLADG